MSIWERAERDYAYFGREPTPSDLLRRHLRRIGADETNQYDAYAHAQTSMLRLFLGILQAALDDEGVAPDVARRVIERVIYGAVPQPPVSEQRMELLGKLTEAVANQDPMPNRWLRD